MRASFRNGPNDRTRNPALKRHQKWLLDSGFESLRSRPGMTAEYQAGIGISPVFFGTS